MGGSEMKAIIYEDADNAYDAVDMCNLIREHKEQQATIKRLAEHLKEAAIYCPYKIAEPASKLANEFL